MILFYKLNNLGDLIMYIVEKTKEINFVKQFDYYLFFSVIVLSVIGLVVLDSATHSMDPAKHNKYMITQLASILLGITAALIISVIDYKYYLKNTGLIIYFVSVVLLVVVLFKGVGDESWGSRSWLPVPFIGSFQPSEIAKIAFVICVSLFLERIKENRTKENIIKLIVYAAIPVLLVAAQLDFGTAIVFLFMFFIMVYVAGIKYRYIFITFGGLLLTTPFIWFFALNDSRKARILEFISPGSDSLNASYQLNKAEMAIGSGRIFGSGLYKGMHTQSNGIPVKESDFIFAVIGEELGFVGAVIVILLILFIIIRCLYIAKNSQDLFGSYLVIGLTSMFGFHFIQNIGMCVRLLPVTGIPLPFVSAGGSAMVTNYIAVGIIMSVSMRRKKTIFNSAT